MELLSTNCLWKNINEKGLSLKVVYIDICTDNIILILLIKVDNVINFSGLFSRFLHVLVTNILIHINNCL